MANVLVISDIHLGRNKDLTISIINNLRAYFDTNKKLFSKLDVIIIAGDTFDKLLTTNGVLYAMCINWLLELCLYCSEKNIILRILEGTPSHDWKQVKILDTILANNQIKLDYKYVDTIYIEHITNLNINIGYIPDEGSVSNTYNVFKDYMKDNNIFNLDLLIMHGFFKYQLPQLVNQGHDEQEYLNIVKGYICIGHIHTPSVYAKILGPGSFDRLAHGEEEDKGGLFIHLGSSNSYQFIKNFNATKYKTLKYNEKLISIDKVVDDVSKLVTEYKYIRVLIYTNISITGLETSLQKKYADNVFSINKITSEAQATHELPTISYNTGFPITKDNIEQLLLLRVKHYNLSEEKLKLFKQELLKIL